MADKVQRPQASQLQGPTEPIWDALQRHHKTILAVEAEHASLIDLIDKTQSCTSGLSFGECLDEIKRRLGE